jgi:hypothetical protein
MKQQTLCLLSLVLMGCGSSTSENPDRTRNFPQVPVPISEDEQRDKPKLYNETGALPSTKEDWERVGVPELTDEEILALAAKENLKQEKVGKSTAPTAPADSSGSTSALAALKGKSGMDATQFIVNGVSGSQIDLELPMYVQLKGSVDQGKSTTGMTGLVAYKLGSSVLGVIQSYDNSGAGFTADSRHLESSIVAAHSFGLLFVEGQFGSISATDVNFNNWSGVRSQVRLGIDTPFGAPFVQLTHKDFGHTSDTAGYVGFEIANSEFKAASYAFRTSLLTKVGHHSVHGATGAIDWTAALNLNSGVAFTTHLTLDSALESKAAFTLSLDR